ncbi:SycD/LcrH family type III secretion system chaperone [Chlamydiales bacterium]|nr:SycD/LcrH family type III secretion system chaperone [Chlamydiales bacterium]
MKDKDFFTLSNSVKKKLKDKKRVKKELSEGKTGQEVLELSDKQMKMLYKGAYTLFEGGKYLDSADAYLFLVTLNPHNYDYWLGLGMSLQLSGNIDGAIDAYEMASLIRIYDPVPYFYLSKCLFSLHQRDSTLQALDLAIENAGDIEEFQDIKTQALAAKNLLLKDFC